MYYAFIENGKINGAGQCKCLTCENVEISQEVFENISKYVYKDGEIILDENHTSEKADIRAVRNSYLEQYVDPKQLILVWDSLTDDDKKSYTDYRQYLLDYTKGENWWESEPLTYQEWKDGFYIRNNS